MSVKVLAKVAVGGAFVCIGTGLYIGQRIENRLKEAAYYKESLAVIRQNRGVVEVMGEPIRDLSIDLGDKANRVDALRADLQVGVKGPKTSGVAYISAHRSKAEDQWTIRRIELTFKNQPNRKLVVYKNEDP